MTTKFKASTQYKVGTRVIFDSKVYSPPWAPYYDEYKGHVFKVIACYIEEPFGDSMSPHYKLECEDDATIKVKGNVHEDDLVYFKGV